MHIANVQSLKTVWRRAAALVSVVALTTAAAVPAHAAELQGQRYADRITLAGQSLQLNGLGMRAVAWIKGYVAGLYVPQKSHDATVLLESAGAKRIALRMLREADTEVFVAALHAGLEKNHDAAQMQQFEGRMAAFDESIRAIGAVKPGDAVNLDFVPGQGLLMSINGQPRGRPIPGEDFYRAVMKIFIGDNPVDKRMKQGLLGNPA